MRGFLPLKLNRGFFFQVYGGPYRHRPEWAEGVKMAMEISAPCRVDIPTKDFNVPSRVLATEGLHTTVDLILQGKPVYVGCAGGIGRTGLLLALLAKAWGEQDPVKYVREHYYAHAVETNDQRKFVQDFPIPEDILKKIKRAKFVSWLRFGKKQLTQSPNP